MKFLKGLWLCGIVLLFAQQIFAQSFSETALLFSRTQPGGSARIQGMGGAQVALGGDYSSAYSNPAGLGMYNRSEFAFTPALNFSTISADYLNQTTKDSNSSLGLPGLSFAFHNDDSKVKGILSGTFAISYNRNNDFNRNMSYGGKNKDNSIVDYFLQDANGGTPAQFQSGGALYNTPTELAYDTYLIGESTILDPSFSNKVYFTDISDGAEATQHETIETRGSQNQWNFSYGANLGDKVFIGAGVGLASIRYSAKKVYTEGFVDEPLSDMMLQENLEIRGSALNATLGAIFRPVDFVQLGVSAATPTAYRLTDTYDASINASWKNFEYLPGQFINNESAKTDMVTSEYKLKTPWRLRTGVAFFIQKKGLITADAEFISYDNSRYSPISSSQDIFSEDNDQIKALYQSAVNLRLGGEVRLNKFRFRGGYSYMPEPFKTEQNGISRVIQSISGGAGYRSEKFYLDMAVIYGNGNNSYRPYRVASSASPLVTYSQTTTNFLVTLGFPF